MAVVKATLRTTTLRCRQRWREVFLHTTLDQPANSFFAFFNAHGQGINGLAVAQLVLSINFCERQNKTYLKVDVSTTDSVVIISSVSKCYCTALLTIVPPCLLLYRLAYYCTALLTIVPPCLLCSLWQHESMLSKRPVLKIELLWFYFFSSKL